MANKGTDSILASFKNYTATLVVFFFLIIINLISYKCPIY